MRFLFGRRRFRLHRVVYQKFGLPGVIVMLVLGAAFLYWEQTQSDQAEPDDEQPRVVEQRD